MTCKIYIVRHGESIHNLQDLNSGHSETPLTEMGRKQAESLRGRLSHVHFDEVYSSDLERAAETAAIIYGKPVPQSHQLFLLRERNFGSLEGVPAKQRIDILAAHESQNGKLSPKEKWIYKNVPDMESDHELAERFIQAVEDIAKDNLGKTILIAAHGGILRTLLIGTGHGSYSDYSSGAIKNASYIVLAYDGSRLVVEDSRDALGA